MILKQNIYVVAIVTEKFRVEMIEALKGKSKEVDMEIGQLEQQGQRYLMGIDRQNIQQMLAIRQEIEGEKKKAELVKTQFQEKIREIEGLPLGVEYPYSPLEGFIEVKVGDNLFDKIAGQQIVIKDGIIQEIRGSS